MYGLARVTAMGALVMTVLAVLLVLLAGGGEQQRLRIRLENASQLVKGNQVKVGGVPVGTIERIELTNDNQAELRVRVSDGDLVPLHAGTKATVRQTSLSGVANRYVALEPGPNNAPVLPDQAIITAQDTRSSVDLDAVLNTVDAETRRSLRAVIHQSAETYDGVAPAASAGLEALNPAIAQTRKTIEAVMRDEQAFERAIVESAAVVATVSGRDPDLRDGLRDAGLAAQAVAAQRSALAETLQGAPGTLRRANTTLVNLRGTLEDVRPALREARPVAPRLARLLRTLAPVARRSRPVIADARRALPDVRRALAGLPALRDAAVPAFASAAAALTDAAPVVAGARPFTPDLIGGFINGFGGTTGSYYDANGHYARISVQGSPFSLNNAGSLVPIPPQDNSLSRFRKGVVARCPGAAIRPAEDGSNPWVTDEAPCDPGASP